MTVCADLAANPAQIRRLTLYAENDTVSKISKLKLKITLKSQILKPSFLDELDHLENFDFWLKFSMSYLSHPKKTIRTLIRSHI